MSNHYTAECWYDERNAYKAPWNNKPKSDDYKHKSNRDNNKTTRFKSNFNKKREEANWMWPPGVPELLKKIYEHGKETAQEESKSKASSKRKNYTRDDYDANYELDNSLGSNNHMNNEPKRSDNSSNKSVSDYSLHPIQDLRPAKRSKHTHYSADVVVEIENVEGNRVPIRTLLDTGTSATIILQPFVKKGRISHHKKDQMTWDTMGGTFLTERKALIDFKFPELNTKTVTWTCHVDDQHSPKEVSYDMIIGMDLMVELGIFVNTATLTIDWGEHSAPLKPCGCLADSEYMEALYHLTQEPPVLQQAEEQHNYIIEADYSTADIKEHVGSLKHLSQKEQERLYKVLILHTNLFSEGLGLLNIPPVELEVKEDAIPFHVKPFPLPYAYEAPAKKEIERFCDIGVMKKTERANGEHPHSFNQRRKGTWAVCEF